LATVVPDDPPVVVAAALVVGLEPVGVAAGALVVAVVLGVEEPHAAADAAAAATAPTAPAPRTTVRREMFWPMSHSVRWRISLVFLRGRRIVRDASSIGAVTRL
jgi:hypothetical protein